MEKHPIVLIGGGGHAMAVIEVIECQAKYEIRFIWDKFLSCESVLGYPVKKGFNHIEDVIKTCSRVAIGIGQVKNGNSKKRIFQYVKKYGGILPNIISPYAFISKHTHFGEGNVVMHSAVINADTHIGSNCIINSGANIEHGVKVGDHSHISTQAVLNGNCSVGSGSFVGSNATIKERVRINKENVIGAGSVVLHDTLAGSTYVGNPAKLLNSD